MNQPDGTPLNSILERCVFSADEALTLIAQVLQKLITLHAGQAFHGDIKAASLLLQTSGAVELKAPLVTPAEATAATDLYAVGALFFEMMTGLSIGSKPSVPPRPLQYPIDTLHWIPNPVRDVVAKLCAPLPEHRYASAELALKAVQALPVDAVNPSELGALAREIENLTEAQLLLSRDTTKTIAKRALAIAVGLHSRIAAPDEPFILPHATVAAALIQVRGERVALVPVEPVRKPLIRTAPVEKQFPWMESGLGFLVLAGLGFIFLGPRLNLAFHKKPAAQVVAAKPVVKAMPDNQATSPKTFWLPQYEGPRLSWTNSVDGYDAFLHISRSANFAMRVVDVTVRGNQYKIAKEMEEGRYYWRLWDRATQKSVGPFEFTLSHLEPPQILTPINQQSLTIAPTYTTVILDVSWVCKPNVLQYEVVITDHTGAMVTQKTTDQCMLNSEQLGRGEYSLRVRVAEPVGEMNAWSEAVAFWVKGGSGGTLTKIRQVQPRTPAQAFPKSK